MRSGIGGRSGSSSGGRSGSSSGGSSGSSDGSSRGSSDGSSRGSGSGSSGGGGRQRVLEERGPGGLLLEEAQRRLWKGLGFWRRRGKCGMLLLTRTTSRCTDPQTDGQTDRQRAFFLVEAGCCEVVVTEMCLVIFTRRGGERGIPCIRPR
ncbi:hypothetical protein Vafri_9126 [Volvox africanus]|uniref:Uncharacterized protein n=1 Tax=Volvox africanus TaxID=51714 RepID=A0A8J4EZG5_9CHLO|nr:hypothetical protein Vafri_9126 [Volvox africanus]